MDEGLPSSGDLIPLQWSEDRYNARYEKLIHELYALPKLSQVLTKDYLTLYQTSNWYGASPQTPYVSAEVFYRLALKYRSSSRLSDLALRACQAYTKGTDPQSSERFWLERTLLDWTNTESTSTLKELIERFSHLPDRYKLVSQTARSIGNDGDTRSAVTYLEQFLSLPDLPKHIHQQLSRDRKAFLSPYHHLHPTKSVFVGTTPQTLKVRSQHAHTIALQIYKIPTPVMQIETWKPSSADKPIATLREKLKTNEKWQPTQTTIQLKALAPGAYLVYHEAEYHEYAIRTSAKRGDRQHTVFQVSNYSPIILSGMNGWNGVQMLNISNGEPWTNLSLISSNDYRWKASSRQIVKTNAEGFASFDTQNYEHRQFKVLNDDDPLRFDAYFQHKETVWHADTNGTSMATITTDRTIYKPGQTAHVYGYSALLMAHAEQSHISANAKLQIKLYDANFKETHHTEVTTDHFGRYSLDIPIPSDGLLGNYTIEVWLDGKKLDEQSISVAEYKRPSVELDIQCPKGKLHIGDTAKITIQAKAYSGEPIKNARLNGIIRKYLYQSFSDVPSQNQHLDESIELTTDMTGRAVLSIPITHLGKQLNTTRYITNTYDIDLRITTLSGEVVSQREELTIREGFDQLRHTAPTSLWAESDTFALSFHTEGEAPIVHYTLTHQGKVARRDSASTEEPIVLTDWLRQASSGEYLLEYYAVNPFSRERISGKGAILICRQGDRSLHMQGQWLELLGEKNQYVTGNQPQIRYITSLHNSYVFYSTVADGRLISRGMLRPQANKVEYLKILIPNGITEQVEVSLHAMQAGKLYQTKKTYRRIQPDRSLTLRWDTFRDRIQAGQSETWQLTILHKGKPIRAALSAWMYDGALDAIRGFSPPNHLSSSLYNLGAYSFPSAHIVGKFESLSENDVNYDDMIILGDHSEAEATVELSVAAPMANRQVLRSLSGKTYGLSVPSPLSRTSVQDTSREESLQGIRTNFGETVFFRPELETDAKGIARWSFNLPEALTRWRVVLMAHTEELSTGLRTDLVETYRMLMVKPLIPRFIRLGDSLQISTDLVSMSGDRLSGTLSLELFDPDTDRIYSQQSLPFSLEAHSRGSYAFTIEAPDGVQSVGIRIKGKSREFSDGEQHVIPVLPATTSTTLSIALTATEPIDKTYDLKALFPDGYIPETGKLMLRLESNPLYLALLALPAQADVKSENSIDLANAIYAETLTRHITASRGFEDWINARRSTGGMGMRHDRGKQASIALDKTPWLKRLEREDETARIQSLITWFDSQKVVPKTHKLIERLRKLQLADGRWSWFPGMKGSDYLTLYIMRQLVRTEQFAPSSELSSLITKGWEALHRAIGIEIQEIKKWEQKHKSRSKEISHLAFEYLYLLARMPEEGKKYPEYSDFLIERLRPQVHNLPLPAKISVARIFASHDRKLTAELIRSLREHLSAKGEGLFFANEPTHPYWWCNRTYETHTRMIELLHDLTPSDTKTIRAMQYWLLEQKRSVAWESSIATSEAIYGLLLGNEAQLQNSRSTHIKLHMSSGRTIEYTSEREALDLPFAQDDYPISITLTPNSSGQVWGSAIAQYKLPISAETKSGRELKASRSYARREVVDGKERLIPLSDGERLRVGQELITLIQIEVDRDIDFIRLSDPRIGCTEPIEQTAQYTWGGGTAYYYEPRDRATNFYFDHLSRGRYTLRHTQFVTRSGRFIRPSASLISVYAPEYTATTGVNAPIIVGKE